MMMSELVTCVSVAGVTTKQMEFLGLPGERPQMVRRNTFTKPEGEFESETTSRSEFRQFDHTQRTEIVQRREDNLTVGEGKFTVSNKRVIFPHELLSDLVQDFIKCQFGIN